MKTEKTTCNKCGKIFEQTVMWEDPFEKTCPQCELQANKSDMDLAKEQFDKCFDLMKSRNSKYGNSWEKLRNSSIIDLCVMKLDRCQKQELDSKALEVEAEDIVNYMIFLLINLRNK